MVSTDDADGTSAYNNLPQGISNFTDKTRIIL